jgi:hypothetical protein
MITITIIKSMQLNKELDLHFIFIQQNISWVQLLSQINILKEQSSLEVYYDPPVACLCLPIDPRLAPLFLSMANCFAWVRVVRPAFESYLVLLDVISSRMSVVTLFLLYPEYDSAIVLSLEWISISYQYLCIVLKTYITIDISLAKINNIMING